MKKPGTIFLFFLIAVLSCVQKKSGDTVYHHSLMEQEFDLTTPSKQYQLPKSLHEISGITAVNDSIVACIADEKGEVYFYNLNSSKIDKKLKFTEKGDFEDLTNINDTMYVLDSKGTVWVIKNYLLQPEISSVVLNIEPPFELEGLCHRKDSLFIAAKYYHNKKRDQAGGLPVWRLTQQLSVDKLLFTLPDLIQEQNEAIPFHTSAIVFDEENQRWLCLSTHGKWLIQCDYLGNILNRQQLPAQEFIQPEGICFTPKGDLLISNEGRDGAGTILLFSRLKN